MSTNTTSDQFNQALAEAVDKLTDDLIDAGPEWQGPLYECAKKLFSAWQYSSWEKGFVSPNVTTPHGEIQIALRNACYDSGLSPERDGLQIGGATQSASEDARVERERLDEAGSWAPVNFDMVSSEIAPISPPSLGMAREDGLRLIYPGREHSILGDTESGKTWLALGCVAAELAAGQHVVYIHFEEGDAVNTLERLTLLGVDFPTIAKRLRFVAPDRPVREDWIDMLCDPAPALAVLDGVNEAMGMHELSMDPGGVSEFRRLFVTPFRATGAAVVECDHFPISHDSTRRDAYGGVHKGNALDGARIQLESVEPFGKGMCGRSRVFVTKDRPGHLRAHGQSTEVLLKTLIGTLVIDAGAKFAMSLSVPTAADVPQSAATAGLAGIVYDVIAAMPGHTVPLRAGVGAADTECGPSGSQRQDPLGDR